MIHLKVKRIREGLGYTQSDLAERCKLSVRTIQRIEAGATLPKGHSLNALAIALGVEKTELRHQQEEERINSDENLRLRTINIATLCFMCIPFGNILIPMLIWKRKSDKPEVDEIARRIINFQLLWTLSTAILLIISPFLQSYFPANFVLILMIGLLAVCINLFFIIKTALSLARSEYDFLALKPRLL